MSDIYPDPTVSGLALALQTPSDTQAISLENMHRNAKQAIQAFAHKHSHSLIESVGVTESDVEQIAPCTSLQEGIIYHFLSSTTPMYCSSFTFELLPSVDLEKLRTAWEQTQSQVQMLRARFSPSPDGYAQVILKKDSLPWFHIGVDSDSKAEISQREQFEKWISRLEGLPTQLWEIGLVSSPGKNVMCLHIFHALYDGNSLELLLDLVSQNYHGQKSSKEAPDFLDVLHLGPLCKDPSAETYWKGHLASSKNRPLPTSDPESNGPITKKAQIDSTEHLDHLRKSLNVTEQAVLHACWLLTLHRHYNFVPPLGIIASGRTIDVPGIENVVGPLFNTIPSDVQLRGLKSWAEVAQKCHDYHVSTIPYQYTALRDISKWLGKSPDERLFDSLFVFQREDPDSESSTRDLWGPLYSEAQHEYPLAFEIVRNGNKSLTATLAAKSHLLSSEEAQQILYSFEQLLFDFAQNPDHELPYINGVAEDVQPLTNGHIGSPDDAVMSTDKSQFQWTDQACTIRKVIASLAGVEEQSINEGASIFEVGLDSIDAIKLSSRLSKSGIKLPVSSIMRYRNIKAMSDQLATTNQSDKSEVNQILGQLEGKLSNFLRDEGLLPEGASRILPATPIQEAMMAEMTTSGHQHYYNHEILEIEPGVDLAKLQEAWAVVVKAHPILRTSFVEVWDPEIPVSYAQIVHAEGTFDAQTVYLNGAAVDSIIETQRARAVTDLASRPLLTITTAIDGDKRHLVLSVAHALYDGWSINLLHEDVAKSYAGEDCSRPSSDAILQQIIKSSGDQALKFWRAALSNCTPTEFPPSKNAEHDSKAVHRAERSLSVPAEKAEAFCKRHGITMQALLVSCWSLVLAINVKNLDVVFGLVLSGRNVADSENVMFPTMNTVAMRAILHGTRLELVKYIQETLLEMSEHQHFPLRRARPDTRSRQLFDTLFIYQKRPSGDSQKGPALYHSTGGASDVEYPVCAEVEGVGEELVGRVACRGSVLGGEDTEVLLQQIEQVLSSLVDEPTQQTVNFTGDALGICGHLVIQDTPNGVVENGTLPATSTPTAWSPTESKIRNMLSLVSGVPEESIDKDTTIFHLGLDSISAIKVAALMKKQSVKLAVSDMLRAGTIAKMAEAANTNHAELTPIEINKALEDSVGNIDVNALLVSYGIDVNQIQSTMPATAGQTYFLAMHSLNPTVFYPEFHYVASTQLSREALESAWTRLVEQMSILRTAFIPTTSSQGPAYIQVVFNSVDSSVIWHDNIENQIGAEYVSRDFGLVPAALHASPTAEGTALTLHIHHALYDAVSLPFIMDQLARLCSQGQSESKPEVHNMAQLVATQHARSPMDVRRQFWQKYLGQISIDGGRGKRLGEFSAIQPFYRPGLVAHMSRVEAAGKRRSLSIQSIFLAVFAQVYAGILAADESVSSSKDVQRGLVVGLYLANRSQATEGLSELIAPTVNIVPLRLDDKLSGDDESLLAAARRIQDEINEISRVEYSGVSLVEIAEWTGVRISTCVNFLRLPELEDADVPGNNDQVNFKSVSREELAASNRLNLPDAAHSHTNGDTAASVSAPGMRAAASAAAMGDVFWVS